VGRAERAQQTAGLAGLRPYEILDPVGTGGMGEVYRAMYALEGASIGLQLGGAATDFVLLVMNDKGAKSVLSSNVKLGAGATAAAGPKGRTAEAATDIVMKAEILSYSRSRGIFAGVSLEGSTLRSDGSANKNLYGKELNAEQIVAENAVKTPAAGQGLIDILNKRSPKNLSQNK
jgi:SH3 domain-containing YSC84-like protein 1